MFHFREKNLYYTDRCDYWKSDEQQIIELFWFTADVMTALTNLFQSVQQGHQPYVVSFLLYYLLKELYLHNMQCNIFFLISSFQFVIEIEH